LTSGPAVGTVPSAVGSGELRREGIMNRRALAFVVTLASSSVVFSVAPSAV
jgi:hypothetical protein